MSAGNWNDIVTGLATAPAWALLYAQLGHRMGVRWFRLRATFYATFLRWWEFGAGAVVAWLAFRHWVLASAAAVSVAVAYALDWHRKHRKQVRALLGAKSRALRDALAARMPRPRPALIPQRDAA